MKRIIQILVLITMFFVFFAGKSIVDKKDRVIIYDSSVVDTTLEPVIIPKSEVVSVRIKNGSVWILVPEASNPSINSGMVRLHYSEFTQFTSNEQLLEWVEEAVNNEYYKQFEYTGSDLSKVTYNLIICT